MGALSGVTLPKLSDDFHVCHPDGVLTQKSRYALRSLLYLVEEGAGAPIQLARIADTQKIPPKYLELIMLELKKAGIVRSTRGPRGGYVLTRSPHEISFGAIVRALEGPIALISCASENFYAPCGDCHDEVNCAIRRAFMVVRDETTRVLDSISLSKGADWEGRLPASDGSEIKPG
ncbi:Rrf2 family transcriptional regulator [Sphingomonas sp. BN140010]|uniref:Rrf2 family transcriptional regulator n=1 Tax=Sphingomonas arvum TaxID=2992113 RepID=A0ABT3JG78_9SPHN|nr:Rrf2 family transcriptional regulator [Sphingomonas sp. BN140010]MCW3798072.1 Rrf2 family transcriptional regulator [Sphingomonas sp. BN140010]